MSVKLHFHKIKNLFFLASFSLLFLACSREPKAPSILVKEDYSYVKEYMTWYIKEQISKHYIVGLSVAFVDDKKIVWEKGFGYADKKNHIKATGQTRYRVGFVNKRYAKYIHKVLLEPLRMLDSKIEMKLEGEFASKGYRDEVEERLSAMKDLSLRALDTTVSDLSRLGMMLCNKGVLHNTKVLNAQIIEEMFHVQNKNPEWNIGREIDVEYFTLDYIVKNKEHVYGYFGGMMPHKAVFIVAPKSKLTVVVLANSVSTNVKEIGKELLQKVWESKHGEFLEKKRVLAH